MNYKSASFTEIFGHIGLGSANLVEFWGAYPYWIKDRDITDMYIKCMSIGFRSWIRVILDTGVDCRKLLAGLDKSRLADVIKDNLRVRIMAEIVNAVVR